LNNLIEDLCFGRLDELSGKTRSLLINELVISARSKIFLRQHGFFCPIADRAANNPGSRKPCESGSRAALAPSSVEGPLAASGPKGKGGLVTMGQRLQSLMKQRNWDNNKFLEAMYKAAQNSGCRIETTIKAVQEWVADEHHPDIKIIPVMAAAFGIETAKLVTGLTFERALQEPVALPGETEKQEASFSRRVLILRWISGMTPAEFARKAKIGEGTVTHTEQHLRTYPHPASRIVTFAQIFSESASRKITTSELLTGFKRDYVVKRLRYPKDKITFLRLCAGLTQEDAWARLVDDFMLDIEEERGIAQWERGSLPTDPKTRTVLTRMYRISWEELAKENKSGKRLSEFIGLESVGRLKEDFAKALDPGKPDSALVARFPNIANDFIMAYDDSYDVDSIVDVFFELIVEAPELEQARVQAKILRSLDFYQKLFLLRTGTWRFREEQAKLFASIILKKLVEKLNRNNFASAQSRKLAASSYWCDIVAALAGRKDISSCLQFIKSDKEGASFLSEEDFISVTGASKALADQYGLSNIALRLGFSVALDLTSSGQFFNNGIGFKKRVWDFYVKHKRFPGVEEGGLCRQDLWAIELLRTFFSGSLDMFRIRFFEERAQEIKDYIARQAHKDYMRMFREFLSVLPFDREAIEFSEKDREERARDQERMKEIIPDYDTNIKYYKWFEGGPKEFRASDNL
ncbi:MAG: hypothetical protein KJ818_06305, partial [Candidatus Omnitrophica bacterium]|nr:hypothetical protein [Candidatus Omnitrophota bacterium]